MTILASFLAPAGRAFIFLLVVSIEAVPAALAAEYTIEPGGSNFVEFVSKAPVETVTGKTQQITGRIDADPSALGDSIEVVIEVDLASLDTGIGLRNRHMRENHLHTDRYPKAVFRGGRISGASHQTVETGRATTFRIAGDFELHGVRRRIEAPVEATLRPDGSLRAVVRFEVRLPDYDIPRPQFLVMRLDELQRITLDVTARAAAK